MNSSNEILDFDSLISDIDEVISQYEESKKTNKTKKPLTPKQKGIQKDFDAAYDDDNFLNKLASKKLRMYFENASNIKAINQQIKIISSEIMAYRSDKEIFDKCQDRLKILINIKDNYKTMFSESARHEHYTNTLMSMRDPEVVELSKKIRETRARLHKLSPGLLVRNFCKMRKDIQGKIDDGGYVYDIDTDKFIDPETNKPIRPSDVSTDDIDDIETNTQYYNMLEEISNVLGESEDTVENMSQKELTEKVKNAMGDDSKEAMLRDKIQTELDELTYQRGSLLYQMNKDNIVEFALENYDLTDENDSQAIMEVLASSKTQTVYAIAHSVANKYNAQDLIKDLIAEGMLILYTYLLKWKDIQLQTNVPVPVDVIIGVELYNGIKAAVRTLRGEVSKRYQSDQINRQYSDMKKAMEEMKKDNPFLSELTDNQLMEIYKMKISGDGKHKQFLDTIKIENVTSIMNRMGISPSDENPNVTDIVYGNKTQYDTDLFDTNSRINEVADSIKFLMDFIKNDNFKTKKGYGGEQVWSDKKIINDINVEIIKMMLGAVKPPEGNVWKQQQMADYLKMTHGSLNYRIQNINEILKQLAKRYPRMKKAQMLFDVATKNLNDRADYSEALRSTDKGDNIIEQLSRMRPQDILPPETKPTKQNIQNTLIK